MIDYFRLLGPLVRLLDAETAHGLTVRLLKTGLVPRQPADDDPVLACRLWGMQFPNPIGLAAGFDKNAEVPDAMLGQGFGFVEVGSVTPRPQRGNPRPRMFRLSEDAAVINRMGFNNEGIAAAAARLARRPRRGVVGVNLGKNKDTEDAAADYERGAAALAAHADYLVINVSSPNTPGLRALQGRAQLDALIGRMRTALDATLPDPPPLLLKVAPDLTDEDKADIAAIAVDGRLDGLIVANTTISRPAALQSPHRGEPGGLSGKPLFPLATDVLRQIHVLTEGRLPLIGVGGVASGRDAYAKIRAGASLVQLYSALVYQGPGLVTRIKKELGALLRADGFANVAEAVGADHRRET